MHKRDAKNWEVPALLERVPNCERGSKDSVNGRRLEDRRFQGTTGRRDLNRGEPGRATQTGRPPGVWTGGDHGMGTQPGLTSGTACRGTQVW